jgi:diguanylate cyclase (GGDEF)-like protein/PAS domain S-box-containing protein
MRLRLRLGYVLIALLSLALAVMPWWRRADVGLLDRIDRLTLDAQMQWRGPLKPEAPITLLLVDDHSLQALGTADRRWIAQALAKLGDAKLVAFDLLLVEPGDPQGDQDLARAMAKSGRVLIPFALPPEAGPATEPSRVLLNNAFTATSNEAGQTHVPVQPARLLAPVPAFANVALGLGHVTALRGADGALRYDLPGLVLDGETYPSLALRIAAAARNVPWSQARMNFGNSVQAGPLTAQLDALSRQWLNYYGEAGTFEHVRLSDLLAGRVDKSRLAGRIVIAGVTAVGSGDQVPTPFDASLPGVERLATSVDNLLSGRTLIRPVWAAPAELAAMVLLPLLAVSLIGGLSLRRALPVLAGVAVLIVALLQWRFVSYNEFLAPVFPALALLLATGGALILRGGIERMRRLAALEQLQASERRYALAAQGANDGLWDWDLVTREVHFSPRWRALMGLAEEEAKGIGAWVKPLPPAQASAFKAALQEHLDGRSQQLHHLLEFVQGGQTRWLLARAVATRENGKPVRMAGSLTDVSELHRLQHQLSHDALHDRLTGLPNRNLFQAQLEQLLASNPAGSMAMLLVGLDGFRAFNEKHGLIVGDAALVEVARRLRQREGLPLARIGPDEFAIAAPMRAGSSELVAWARSCFAEPVTIGAGEPLRLTAGIGLAHASEGLGSAGEMMVAAEDALARAKQQGPGQSHRFDAAEQLVEQSRRWMVEQIDLALRDGKQFALHYQPFVRLADRQLLGFEALIRWTHPTKGLVMPGDFIPVAESSGQIAQIGRWTLMEAAAQLRHWHGLGFTGEIAVNVSGVQLEREVELLSDARAVLAALGPVPAHQLKLEVTESMAMSNPQRSAETLQELARLGFKISIDDFGTGYSSLAYLHRFPFDTLKIDRSFVMRLNAGREAQEIVRTIVGLTIALDKQALAEGVEDEKQAQLLEQLGVQVAQGWLFAKALPAPQAEALIKKSPWRKPAVSSDESDYEPTVAMPL